MALVSFRTINYNPNHDPSSGRFSSGGGGSKTTQEKLGIKSIETSELANELEGGKEKYIYDVKSDKYIIVKDVIPTRTFHDTDSAYPSKEATKENIDKLSSAEKSAITGYTSEYGYGSYNEVNKYLRNPNSKKYSQETIDSANGITSALNKAKLGTNTYVYRGVSAESFEDAKIQKAILDTNRMIKNGKNRQDVKFLDTLASLKGSTITDKAPTSTSPNGGQFFNFGEVKMTIKTKKSDKAMDITSLSRFGGSSITPAFLGVQQKESEVLYAPNTTFKITDVKVNASGIHLLMETVDSKNKNSIELNYSPKQQRDSSGKWSSGGGSYSTKYSNMTPHEYANSIKEEYGKQTTFTSQEIEEIDGYTDMSFAYTNEDLKNARGNVNKLDDYRKITVKTLDKSMRHKLNENTMLYRGMHTEKDIYEGHQIKWDGYSSTSMFRKKGESFATQDQDRVFDTPYLLSIKAKKGQKGIIPLLTGRNNGLQATEAEFILPRGTNLNVIKRIEQENYIELVTEVAS
jgi:hypothetical protein